MSAADTTEPDSAAELFQELSPPRPRRRWFQFHLATLLIVTGVCGLAMLAYRTITDALPYRQQRQTQRLIEELGGSYQSTPASSWHRRLFGSDLTNLVTVNLADSDAAGKYSESIAQLPQLETLLVGGEAFTDEHLRHLHGTQSLRHLVLDSTSVSGEGIAALRTALPQVTVYPSERRAIAVLTKWTHLTRQPGPVPAPLQGLVGDEYFETCRTICAPGRPSAAFTQLRHLSHLQTLRLPEVVDDVTLSYLRGRTTLQDLHFDQAVRITDAGLAHLQTLTNLRQLELADASISDAGLVHLAELNNLVELDLSATKLTGPGLVYLRGLTKLEHLDLDLTHVSKAAVEELRRALPKCSISVIGVAEAR